VPADGCAVFPEAELNATGTPAKGATPYAATKGFIDAHSCPAERCRPIRRRRTATRAA
jgi:hypothetical protein